MSQFTATHFVQQYTTNVKLLSQQMMSRLRGSVTEGSYVGQQGVAVEQFVPIVAQLRTTRYPALVPADTQTDRRWVFPASYDANDLTDKIDLLKMLIDPTSSYVKNFSNALNRAMDDQIIASFFGVAKTGVSGSISTAFPATQQIVVTEGASAATGMNVEKLKAGIQLLLAAEAWDPATGDPIYCAISAKQNRNLMDEIQVINADYNGDKLVQNEGFVSAWGPVRFIHSERLPLNVSSQFRCPMWVKEGMHLGIWQDAKTNITERTDLAGHPHQVYTEGTFGGARLEEKKVVEIPCV